MKGIGDRAQITPLPYLNNSGFWHNSEYKHSKLVFEFIDKIPVYILNHFECYLVPYVHMLVFRELKTQVCEQGC